MKKILLTMIMLSGLSAFSVEKPKFEIGGSVGYAYELIQKNGVAPAISFDAKWSSRVSEKYTVFYGVGGDLALEYLIDTSKSSANNKINFNIFVDALVEGQYDINDDVKWYTKAKLGLGPKISLEAKGSKKETKVYLGSISSLSTGIKYKDFKAGIFGAYGKGLIGLELGYEF